VKNHEWRDGRLLQTNKQWSHLKQRQQEWICGVVKEEHAAHVERLGKLPVKLGKQDVIDRVYDRIEQREIWIPYGEAARNIGKKIDRLNRKARLQDGADGQY
jgi:8-oxo-dGTP diphosphatase